MAVTPPPGNLFEALPETLPEELIEVLAESPVVRVERIVSRGHHSETDVWYDQPDHEWVVVLEGEALLAFDNGDTIRMGRGDYINLPAHCRHRVEWTDPKTDTLWLAIHYSI